MCKAFCFTHFDLQKYSVNISYRFDTSKPIHARIGAAGQRRDGDFMFEKNLVIGVLLDFYGELLTDRKRLALDMYYNEDLSLAEIASEIGISRQGVRDMIKKAQDELVFYESKLGLAQKFSDTDKEIVVLASMLETVDIPVEIKKQVEKISTILRA